MESKFVEKKVPQIIDWPKTTVPIGTPECDNLLVEALKRGKSLARVKLHKGLLQI